MENTQETTETAIFGGGCFWCTEAVFKMLKGVSSVEPGYSGGKVSNPTYEQVSTGATGHAEVVRVVYDPSLVKYQNLLTVFFGSHDPTTKDRQGNDIGSQYRSVVFFTTPEQQAAALAYIESANESHAEGAPIVTDVVPLTNFYAAEDYHRDYFSNHQTAGYCIAVINPKLQKVQEQYAALLKDIYKK